MSSGKFHDKVNLIAGSTFSGILIGLEQPVFAIGSFTSGWLIATFIFSPDTDTMPKKRTGPLQFFLYPYSLMFKHRGLSHSFLWGTLIRVLYGVILFGIILFILNKMGHISYSGKDYAQFIKNFIFSWDFSLLSYQAVTWFFVGMLLADIHHYFLDIIVSLFKKIKKKIF